MRVVMLTKPSPALTISQSDTNCTAQSLQYKNGKVRRSFDSSGPACVLRDKTRLSSVRKSRGHKSLGDLQDLKRTLAGSSQHKSRKSEGKDYKVIRREYIY